MGIRKIWLQLDCAPEPRYCLFDRSSLVQGGAKIAVCFCIVRPDRNGSLIVLDGFVEVALLLPSTAKVEVDGCVLRIEFQNPVIGVNRFVKSPSLMKRIGQVVESLGEV